MGVHTVCSTELGVSVPMGLLGGTGLEGGCAVCIAASARSAAQSAAPRQPAQPSPEWYYPPPLCPPTLCPVPAYRMRCILLWLTA
eukprot:3008342-Rhodomonas_salina.1